jgi:hypothetical protein
VSPFGFPALPGGERKIGYKTGYKSGDIMNTGKTDA